MDEQLRKFWAEMHDEVRKIDPARTEFKTQQLPLARIKKIMKADEDVRMISAEAPVLFAKACEFFILEMTLRSWNVAEEYKRKTLQRSDVAAAIRRTEVWDFLLDQIPLDENAEDYEMMQKDGEGVLPAAAAAQQQQFLAGFAPPMMQGQIPPGMMQYAGAMLPSHPFSGMPMPPFPIAATTGMQIPQGMGHQQQQQQQQEEEGGE